jgi:hypothetical protein
MRSCPFIPLEAVQLESHELKPPVYGANLNSYLLDIPTGYSLSTPQFCNTGDVSPWR